MILIDDVKLEPAALFDAMVQEFPDVVNFDWDTAWEAANEPVLPWQWEWRTPLRGLVQQLTNRSDVTAWTVEAGRELAAALEETGLLPIVAAEGGTAPSTVSAEGEEGPSTL